MHRDGLEKLKKFFQKKDNWFIIILTGILLLIIAWPVSKEEEKSSMSGLWDRKNRKISENTDGTKEENGKSGYAGELDEAMLKEEYIVKRLEERLEGILTSIYGVGKVKVMVTLSSSGEKIVEKDIPLERSNILEKDSSGGNRSTNDMRSQEETVYSTTSQGDKIPYVIRENSAVVEGVSVVAQGGDNPSIQKNISDVIQALFGIEAHKIKVVKMKQEE